MLLHILIYEAHEGQDDLISKPVVFALQQSEPTAKEALENIILLAV